MIADSSNTIIKRYQGKKFTTPIPSFRALFFLFIFISVLRPVRAQTPEIDSLIHWVVIHPVNDSMKMYMLHHISYKLSEIDTKKSFDYYEQLSRLSDSLHFTYGKALANINLGILLSSAGNFEAGNKAYFTAFDLAKSCGARRIESVALNNIGENFASLKDFDKCRQYALQAIDINISLRAWRGVAINFEILHHCDFEEQLYKNAKLSLDRGMPYAVLANEKHILSMFYLGYGKLRAVDNEEDSAKYYFNKAILTANQPGELRNEFQAYMAEAKYLTHTPARTKSLLLRKALQLAEQTQYAEGKAQADEQLSTFYDELNNKDSSLYYYRLYRQITDSLFSENNQRNTIVNESEWTIKRKELENNNLKELTLAQRKQIEFKNILLVFIAVGFLLSLFVAFLLYKSFQSKKLKNESQYKQKIAETEMQALQAQMNPHFFFNSLNSIENFIMQNEKKLASDYLNKFARFIRSVLDSSYKELIEINKDLESIQLYIDLEQMRFNNKFTYYCIVDPALLHGEYHVPALLVQPYLENAINHGIGPSEKADLKITLQVMLEKNMIHYVIEDNGIGRDQSRIYNQLNKPFHKSVGMQITQDRINIFNQETGLADSVKITDLFDAENNASGTRIEFAIKVDSHATPQSHSDR